MHFFSGFMGIDYLKAITPNLELGGEIYNIPCRPEYNYGLNNLERCQETIISGAFKYINKDLTLIGKIGNFLYIKILYDLVLHSFDLNFFLRRCLISILNF